MFLVGFVYLCKIEKLLQKITEPAIKALERLKKK